MFRSKHNTHEWLEEYKEVFLYSGVDVIRPFRTKLYSQTWFGWFRFVIYMLLFSYSYRLPSDQRKIPFIRGEYVDRSPSSLEIESVFLHSSALDYEKVVVRDVWDISGLFRKILNIWECFYGSWGSRPEFIHALCYARAKYELDILEEKCRVGDSVLLVTFCDSIGFENLIAQFAKYKGCKTVTLQHGQYRVLGRDNGSQDIEALYNFVSDKMLCWGQATVDEFSKVGVDKCRFIPVGRFMNRGSSMRSAWDNSNTRRFGVVFSGENSRFLNYTLIEAADRLCEKYDLSYVVRPHPSNNADDYTFGVDFKGFVLDESYFNLDFSIMAMTGFFLDCFNWKHPFMILSDDKVPDLFLDNFPLLVIGENPYSIVKDFDYDSISKYFDDWQLQSDRVDSFLRECLA